FTYALRFEFDISNNKAEYEALVAGLQIAKQMGVKKLAAKGDSRLVANQINESYIAKEQSMIQYLEKVKTLISGFKKFSIEHVPRSKNKKADELKAQGKVKFLIVAIDYFTKWIEAKPAHRTMIKTSNEDTSFSLTYGTKSIISVKIGMPSLRCAEVDQILNDEALLLNLDMLKDERERAAIHKAKSKVKIEKYYNAKVHSMLLCQETSCTAAMRLAKQSKVKNLVQNGKDRMKWLKHLEKEHTRSGMGAVTYFHAPRMSKT
nr:reverse transcriptase domain-containing protein [Tanacetum cinerariifolium]